MAEASPAATSDSYRWLAVWTKPRQEQRAEENLRRQGFEVLLPRISERRRRGRRMQWQLGPMFPRYLFAGLDIQSQSMASIRSTQGCVKPVWLAGQPAYLPPAVIEELRVRCREPATVDVGSTWTINQPLRVIDGPFTGLSALFQARTGEERVRVLLHWLGQWQRAELPLIMLAES